MEWKRLGTTTGIAHPKANTTMVSVMDSNCGGTQTEPVARKYPMRTAPLWTVRTACGAPVANWKKKLFFGMDKKGVARHGILQAGFSSTSNTNIRRPQTFAKARLGGFLSEATSEAEGHRRTSCSRLARDLIPNQRFSLDRTFFLWLVNEANES